MRTATLLLLCTLSLSSMQAQLTLQSVATGLDRPVGITHAGDARLFVTLQRGRIVIVDAAGVREFLDIRTRVRCCGEEGLLSVAFHPRYAENGFFFVYYTDLNGDIAIDRFRVSADPDRADGASRTMVLHIPHPVNNNHNGGQLQFGPDGYLYIGTGDGGAGGDPPNNAQRLETRLGKILRIDVDGDEAYAIPVTNPFVGVPGARPEIWAYGLRNPWRFSFDRATGDLWIADVGQDRLEEVNLQPSTSMGGENYGWRRMEGSMCFNPSTNCNDGSLTLPVIEYGRSGGACSVTGGYRYRGTMNPRLRGVYLYADYCNGVISGARENAGGSWSSELLLDTPWLISTFGEDANGELYVADHADDGTLARIVDTTPPAPRRRAVGR
ncbi:MAG TPA: PQQ-dependent sugar dehydrogenase [Thermoanaerobaculia bacterium]|nr:PQQ-dependent sugar dehydrogenase [Thermoanaerobaculia bacterium]